MSILNAHHHSSWPMIALIGSAAALAMLLTFDPGALKFSDDGGPIRATAVSPSGASAAGGATATALDFVVSGSPNHRVLTPRSEMAMTAASMDVGPPRRSYAVHVPPK
ncbi:hypothetical protein N3C64_14310 [Sedimentimonas flavescens]|nr:hypothetical protein [Sedimentimonas flavescens]